MLYNHVCLSKCTQGLVTLKMTGARGLLWRLRLGGLSISSVRWCLGGPGPPTSLFLMYLWPLLLSWLFLLSLEICSILSYLMRIWPPSWLPLTPLSSPLPFTNTLLKRIRPLSGKPTSGASGQTPIMSSRPCSNDPSSRVLTQLPDLLLF